MGSFRRSCGPRCLLPWRTVDRLGAAVSAACAVGVIEGATDSGLAARPVSSPSSRNERPAIELDREDSAHEDQTNNDGQGERNEAVRYRGVEALRNQHPTNKEKPNEAKPEYDRQERDVHAWIVAHRVSFYTDIFYHRRW